MWQNGDSFLLAIAPSSNPSTSTSYQTMSHQQYTTTTSDHPYLFVPDAAVHQQHLHYPHPINDAPFSPHHQFNIHAPTRIHNDFDRGDSQQLTSMPVSSPVEMPIRPPSRRVVGVRAPDPRRLESIPQIIQHILSRDGPLRSHEIRERIKEYDPARFTSKEGLRTLP